MNNQPKNKDAQKAQIRLPHFAYYEDELTLENCISQIGYMPDLVMKRLGVFVELADGNDRRRIFNTARKQWRNQADWLEYHLLSSGDRLLPELTLAEKIHYKPLGEMSLATRKLAKEISVFTCWMYQKYLMPDHWWLACEQQICEETLTRVGFLDKAQPIGGAAHYKAIVARDRSLDSKALQTTEVSVGELTPMDALEGIAYTIAKENMPFRNGAWQDYRKALKRYARELKNSPLNPAFLVNSKFKLLGKGRDWR